MDNKYKYKERYNELVNELKNRYPIFNNINNLTPDLEIKNIITQHRIYNDKNTNYHKLKEIDCNIHTDYNPLNSPNQPIILRGFCKDTPAFHKWNIHNLPHHFGDNKVNIEYYNSFVEYMTSEVVAIKKYNMKQFLDNKDKEYLYFGETPIRQFKKTTLLRDTQNPRIKPTDYKNSTSVIFLGNKYSGSATHIHVTTFDYVLNQIIGSKTMYFCDLYDNHPNLTLPSTFNKHRKFIMDTRISDHVNINYINHSNIKLYKVTLNPGDSIIIPPWWWHNAISDEFALSVTTKFVRSDTSYLYKFPYMGLYKFAADTLFVQRFDKAVSTIVEYMPYYNDMACDKKSEPYIIMIEENISCFLAFSYFIILMYFYSIILKYFVFYKFNLSIAIPFIMSIISIFEIFGLHVDDAIGFIYAFSMDIFDYICS